MKNKAVFLDRDGVLINDAHHLTSISQVKFYPNAAKAVSLLNKNFRVIIVSNQSVVARGLATINDVKKVNSFIISQLAKKGAKIDAAYFCPHHPSFGPACNCRKPKIGMFLKAKKRFRLNLKKSYFLGDKTVDVKAGKAARTKTILLSTGYAGRDREYKLKPDFRAKTLLAAARKIVSAQLK